jgi:hypothetical protein
MLTFTLLLTLHPPPRSAGPTGRFLAYPAEGFSGERLACSLGQCGRRTVLSRCPSHLLPLATLDSVVGVQCAYLEAEVCVGVLLRFTDVAALKPTSKCLIAIIIQHACRPSCSDSFTMDSAT